MVFETAIYKLCSHRCISFLVYVVVVVVVVVAVLCASAVKNVFILLQSFWLRHRMPRLHACRGDQANSQQKAEHAAINQWF